MRSHCAGVPATAPCFSAPSGSPQDAVAAGVITCRHAATYVRHRAQLYMARDAPLTLLTRYLNQRRRDQTGRYRPGALRVRRSKRHRACEQPAQYLPCHIRNGNKGGLVLGPTNSLLYPRGAVAGRHYDAAQAARPVQGQLLAGRGDSASTGLRQQGDSQATSSCPLRAHRHHPPGRSAQGSRWHTATARRRCAGDSACTPLASVGGATQSSQQ